MHECKIMMAKKPQKTHRANMKYDHQAFVLLCETAQSIACPSILTMLDVHIPSIKVVHQHVIQNFIAQVGAYRPPTIRSEQSQPNE